MKKIVSVLGRLNTKAVLIISIAACIYVSYLSNRVGNDALRQIATANNFLNGNGFVTLYTDTNGNIVKKNLTSSPYAYRILATPLMLLTNRSVEATFLILLFLGQALLLFSVYKFISLLPEEYNTTTSNLVLIFMGICTAPMRYFADIDCWTLGIYMIALFWSVRYLKNNDTKYFAGTVILISLLPFFRYAYIVQAASLIFLLPLLDFISTGFSKRKKYLLYLLPLITFAYTIGSTYFTKVSTAYQHKVQKTDVAISYFPKFYAPFFNSFFPDYIILSFLKKFEPFYQNFVFLVLLVFTVTSLLILCFLLINYFKTINWKQAKSILNFLPEHLLIFTCLVNLLFIIVLYKNRTFPLSDVLSGIFTYKSLVVTNRYLAAFHVAVIILSAFFVFKMKSRFGTALFLSALLFGSIHWIYLRTKFSPYNRAENMYFMNEPKGSHEEMLNLYDKLKRETSLYYCYNRTQDSSYYRQVYPYFFASAAGAVICNGDTAVINRILQKDAKTTIVLQEFKNFDSRKYEHYEYSMYAVSENYSFLKINSLRNAQ